MHSVLLRFAALMWTTIAQLEFEPEALGERRYLESNEERCRFCAEDPAGRTFDKDAHAFPAALGNRYVLTREECDGCNERGSSLENDLAAHLTTTRVMSRIPGRNGDVKHRYGNRPSSIASDGANNRLVVRRDMGDDSLVTRRTRDGVRYIFKIPAYRPMNVIRALARVALMLVPAAELRDLDHIRRFVRDELQWASPSFDEAFIPGTGLRRVRIEVDKNGDSTPGEALYRVGVSYGTSILVLHMPGPDMVLVRIPPPPSNLRSPYPPHEVKWRRVSVRRDEVFRGRKDQVDVFVPALAAQPPPTHDEIAVAAYYRWLARVGSGQPGSAVDDWVEGEQDLLWLLVPTEAVAERAANQTGSEAVA